LKILLLNDNPVVNKLVTLSAQKTSDDLEVLDNIEAVTDGSYDLLVVDDTLYTSDLLSKLEEKISFKKSLYICSRDAASADEFGKTIKKPFLPTDLVELFSSLGKEVNEVDLEEEIVSEETLDLEDLQEMSLTPDKDELLDSLGLDELGTSDEDEILDLDEIEDFDLEDELDLDNELDLEMDISTSEEEGEELDLDENTDSILDKDELKEVQDLLDDADNDFDLGDDLDLEEVNTSTTEELSEATDLDEIEDLNLDLEEELTLEEPEAADVDDDLDLGDDLDLEEELTLEEPEPEAIAEDDLDLGDDLDLEEELTLEEPEVTANDDLDLGDDLDLDLEEELTLEEPEELIDDTEDLNIEDQIINAVSELSQEDLDSEIDQETLLEIATTEIDGLNSRDLKMAFGEEVSEVEEIDSADIEDVNTTTIVDEESDEAQASPKGVEALKNLLEALSDKNVVAAMKGMKISINIELGDIK